MAVRRCVDQRDRHRLQPIIEIAVVEFAPGVGDADADWTPAVMQEIAHLLKVDVGSGVGCFGEHREVLLHMAACSDAGHDCPHEAGNSSGLMRSPRYPRAVIFRSEWEAAGLEGLSEALLASGVFSGAVGPSLP